MPPLHFDTARIRLARVAVTAERPFAAALREVAIVAAEALAVGRISVWRYLDDRAAIRCDFLYQPGRDAVCEGAILHLRDLPIYARMLALRRVIAVNDVRGDALADEFREPYFEPLGITAMLDAPIYHQGEVAGIMCHEQLDTPRVWTSDEAELAAAVADAVGRLYEEARLVSASDSLGAYRSQVEQLRHLSGLGRLAAGMAHDFANVLLVADGHAELALAHPAATDALRADIQAILDVNARGHRLVHALLRLARPSSQRPRVVDVKAVVDNAAPMLRMAAGARVTLTVETASGMSRVLVDPAELERCLVNLVLNARDALPDGGHIRCRGFESAPRRQPNAAPIVTIEIEDDGQGMDPETLRRAFEPFFSTKGAAGTGLGLAVVQQTVVMAGGFVEAVPRRGRAPPSGSACRRSARRTPGPELAVAP
ncbi:MAG: ATP-binding protein [Vicinamibacterales bacterium]